MSKLTNFLGKAKTMPITAKRKLWFIIAGGVLLVSAIFMSIYAICGLGALNLGIDFTGGTVLDIKLGDTIKDEANYVKARNTITGALDAAGLTYSAPQRTNEDIDPAITVRYRNTVNGVTKDNETINEITSNLRSETSVKDKVGYESIYVLLKAQFPEITEPASTFFQFTTVGATASSEIWLNALLCVLIAAVLILVYVGIRFKFDTGIAAITALVHDILIMISFVAIFRVQINAPFIAAMITIIGYSINNTIVIFDRVRENLRKTSVNTLAPFEIADISIRETFVRTVNTSITTLFTTLMLFIVGVSSIREFMFPIIVGLLAGTYSSLCIAPSVWTLFRDHKLKKSKSYVGKDGEKKADVETSAIEA